MLGIDIVDIDRIKKIYQRHGLLFLEKILDSDEINELAMKKKNFFKILSCYIASKEAIFKACAEDNLDWREISIRHITKRPLIYIRKGNCNRKIRLTFAINKEMALAQALVV